MPPGLSVARPGDHPRAANRSTDSTRRRASGRNHAAAASRSESASSQSTRRGPGMLGQSYSGSGGRPTIFLASLCDVCENSPRRFRSSHRAMRARTPGSALTGDLLVEFVRPVVVSAVRRHGAVDDTGDKRRGVGGPREGAEGSGGDGVSVRVRHRLGAAGGGRCGVVPQDTRIRSLKP